MIENYTIVGGSVTVEQPDDVGKMVVYSRSAIADPGMAKQFLIVDAVENLHVLDMVLIRVATALTGTASIGNANNQTKFVEDNKFKKTQGKKTFFGNELGGQGLLEKTEPLILYLGAGTGKVEVVIKATEIVEDALLGVAPK